MKGKFLVLMSAAMIFSSCQINLRSMRESNYQLWLTKADMSYTEPKLGTADQTKVFGIDWKRLFNKKFEYGALGNLPSEGGLNSSGSISINQLGSNSANINSISSIISNTIGISSTSRIEQFAINDLIVSNPGYDVILFPQFEVKKKWFLIGSKTHVEVKARLAKLTPNNQ